MYACEDTKSAFCAFGGKEKKSEKSETLAAIHPGKRDGSGNGGSSSRPLYSRRVFSSRPR